MTIKINFADFVKYSVPTSNNSVLTAKELLRLGHSIAKKNRVSVSTKQ